MLTTTKALYLRFLIQFQTLVKSLILCVQCQWPVPLTHCGQNVQSRLFVRFQFSLSFDY